MTQEEQIAKYMANLKIDREEAIALLEDDRKVDKMTQKELTADLTAEQKAVIKKSTQADRKPTVYNFNKRERKANDDKRFLIDLLEQTLTATADGKPTILNPEREIEFFYNGKKYKVTLSAPRS